MKHSAIEGQKALYPISAGGAVNRRWSVFPGVQGLVQTHRSSSNRYALARSDTA